LITGYVLNVTSLKTGTTQQIFTQSTAFTLESLSPHTVYTTAVAAGTSAGRGPFSAKVSVQTLEDGMYSSFDYDPGESQDSKLLSTFWILDSLLATLFYLLL